MNEGRPVSSQTGEGAREEQETGWWGLHADGRGQTTIDFAIGISIFLLVVAFVIAFIPGLLQPFTESETENTVTANRVANTLSEGMLGDVEEPYILDKSCTIAFFSMENSDGDPTNDQDVNDSNDGDQRSTMYNIASDSLWINDVCNFELDDIYTRTGIQGFPKGTGVSVQIELRADVDGNGVDDTLCLDADEQPGPDGVGSPPDPDEEDPLIEAASPYDGSGECDLTGGDHDVLLRTGQKPPNDAGSITVARRVVYVGGNDATLFVRVW